MKRISHRLLMAGTILPMLIESAPGFATTPQNIPATGVFSIAQAEKPGEEKKEQKPSPTQPQPAPQHPQPQAQPPHPQPQPEPAPQHPQPQAQPAHPQPQPEPAPQHPQPQAQPPHPQPQPEPAPPHLQPQTQPAPQPHLQPQPEAQPAHPQPQPQPQQAPVHAPPAAGQPPAPAAPDHLENQQVPHGQVPQGPHPAAPQPNPAAPAPAPQSAPPNGQPHLAPPNNNAPPPPPNAPPQARNRPVPPPPPPGQAPNPQGRPHDGAGAAAIGAAAGFVGGFIASQGLAHLDQIRGQRQEFSSDGVNIIREPGHTIVQEGNNYFIAHDENERFRDLGYDIRSERENGYDVAFYGAPDGSRIYTYTDDQGRLIRRIRRFPDGREIYLIDNRYNGYDREFKQEVIVLPPPPMTLPPEEYEVSADNADETVVYNTLIAPPVAPLPQRYTLDQIRYSPDLRAHMRSIDLNTINFDSGSWTVPPDEAQRLATISQAVNEAIRKNPREIFMVEGYTDAVGNAVDNLSLSDRRAQSVAAILTRDFAVPPENLVTQGYGAQYLKVQTSSANAANRRVTIRRITPLLAQQGQ